MIRRLRPSLDLAYEPLLSPAALLDELPLDDAWAAAVERSRAEVRAVLDGADDRLLVVSGQHGLAGVVLESFLLEGRQEPGDPARLVYGRSVTDACMDIGTTAKALAALSDPVRCRRG